MPDTPDTPAPAEEQSAVADGAQDAPPIAPDVPAAPEATEPTATPLSRSDAIAALIRNGLANSPISQSEATWQALEIRLPEIVAAILEA